MQAFASNWTRPFYAFHPHESYTLADHELLTTILSALLWRRYNGSIRMITDSVGAEYYTSLGLASLWDDGISCELDDIPSSIDPETFWAAGKLYALAAMSAPCVMIDTDFLVWSDIRARLHGHELCVIHMEDLMPDIYPAPKQFVLSPDYTFPADWDWTLPACNTALSFFGNDVLRKTYLREAFAFIRAVRGSDPLIYMIFAEQRLLHMCAHAMHISPHALSTPEQLFSSNQTDFTHIWGFKQAMSEHPELHTAFCQKCAERIMQDYPQYTAICQKIPQLRTYFATRQQS